MLNASKFNLAFRLILTGVIGVISIGVVAAGLGQPSSELTPESKSKDAEKSLNFVQVDNSSVWLPKFNYDKFRAGTELPNDVLIRGKISKADIPVFKTLLAPYLEPRYLQTHQKPHWYKVDPDESTFMVMLDSQGGDVRAALELGRLFRKARVTATVGIDHKCLSSCVFLLAGAVRRYFFGGPVGIHRPYSDDTEPTSFETLQNRTTQLSKEVSSFLKKMNIPSVLYDDMMRVPSEQIKILNSTDLDLYGLRQDDPVFAELQRQAEARAAELSMPEYLPRKAAYDRCVDRLYEQRVQKDKNGMSLEDIKEIHKGEDQCFNQFILKKSQP
jgi:hypothetical protein